MLSINTIMHPTDFSERSDNAYRLACSLARDHGARLIVLHVVPPPQAYGYDEVFISPPLFEFDMTELEEKLRQYKSVDATLNIECSVKRGPPANVILTTAQEANADLIVIGTHGRTGLGRLLMGSVAEQVVRKASCPVLTVKTPFADVESTADNACDIAQPQESARAETVAIESD